MGISRKLGIIGTAGRQQDGPKLNLDSYNAMLSAASVLANAEKITHFVSGGAAWADHVAVSLFLSNNKFSLSLHLPEIFDTLMGQYCSEEFRDTGSVANYYHKQFYNKTKIPSLNEIGSAWAYGATVTVTRGFKERNSKVAEESDVLLAMTFGNGNIVKDGGTADTARKFLALGKLPLYHLDLNTFKLYGNGTVN